MRWYTKQVPTSDISDCKKYNNCYCFTLKICDELPNITHVYNLEYLLKYLYIVTTYYSNK